MANYVHDENNNRIPAYSAEEFLSLLEQVIEDGSLDNVTAENAFITRLKSVADGKTYFVAFLTQAEYNALVQADELEDNTLYIITDDSTFSDIQSAIEQLQTNTSASILQLQSDVGEAQSDISDLQNDIGDLQSDLNGLGAPLTISTDGNTKYAIASKKGLYAVDIKMTDSSDPQDVSIDYFTVMLSIPDLTKDVTAKYFYDGTNDFEVHYSGSNHRISFETLQSIFTIELGSCHLVMDYKDVQ